MEGRTPVGVAIRSRACRAGSASASSSSGPRNVSAPSSAALELAPRASKSASYGTSPASVTTTWRSGSTEITRPDRSTPPANATSLVERKASHLARQEWDCNREWPVDEVLRGRPYLDVDAVFSGGSQGEHCLEGGDPTPCNDDAGTVGLRTEDSGLVRLSIVRPSSRGRPRPSIGALADRVPGNYVPPMRGDRRPVGTCDRVVVGRL